MRCYYSRVLTASGQLETGIRQLAIEDVGSVRQLLETRSDGIVLTLFKLPLWFNLFYSLWVRFGKGYPSLDQISEMLHNLAVMLDAGIPVLDALGALSEEQLNPGMKSLLDDLTESIAGGSSFSESLKKRSDVIPEVIVHLAALGEVSGGLDRTMMDAAVHMQRISRISSDSRRAMIYPGFVFITILGAGFFWLYSVVPNIAQLFAQMQVKLPPITLWTIAFSDLVAENGLMVLMIVLIVVASIVTIYRRNKRVHFLVHKMFYYMPVSRTLVRSSSMAYITEYLSLLLAAGMDLIEGLKLLEQSLGNDYYRQKLRLVREGVSDRGNRLSEEMRAAEIFPSFALRIIAVGEETGTLDSQLAHLAKEYRRRFENVIESLSEILKPVVMIFAGGMFTFLIVALFLPVYTMIGQVGMH